MSAIPEGLANCHVIFSRTNASKSNERRRYLLNKWKCVAVASCLYVTNKISLPSYKLQVLNQNVN